ncbi:hypothetical protein SAMN05216296_1376 [Pseudomonas pohangensis]|uniref:Uncharacterized protein n=1 Tax=Pseudomonas pohangensis TaxID=364197 RepID=A0A1H2F7C1_9PSED|nr:hypothetical protein [Pseudomonas pohangensis]SDU03185.1 hypothetical protein SAMN05216296_1376 [Pseudomonas pohangensis]
MQPDKLKIAIIAYSTNMLLAALSIGFIGYSIAKPFPRGDIGLHLLIFIAVLLLWAIFSYYAYKGLTSDNLLLKIIFWTHTLWNLLLGFPFGTAIALAFIYLWIELKKQKTSPLLCDAPN